jgi:hypothetical protein
MTEASVVAAVKNGVRASGKAASNARWTANPYFEKNL